MRQLVVCCDGTWNTPDQEENGVPVPTNVVRLYNSLAEQDGQGNPQLSYYHPGVGTEGSWWEKVKGGSVGDGLDKNILSAWCWLCRHFQEGDRLFLFGFSRGAYTARSLSGLLLACGLPDVRKLDEADQWSKLEAVFQSGYRKPKDKEGKWLQGLSFLKSPADLRVDFLGVWDTVGALGIPDNLTILNLLDNRQDYAFHNTQLSERVLQARHAVALDEVRASFSPTLWTNVDTHAGAKQVWFPGVHCDVGGGYGQTGLSDGALAWMIAEAQAKGLAFRPGMVKQIKPDFQDVLHDSCNGVFKLLRTQPRSVPSLESQDAEALHSSVRQRMTDPPIFQAPYRTSRSLAAGESATLSIYAAERWNTTGLWLEKGVRYVFQAQGQWLDRTIACGPGGTADGHFELGELGHVASSLWGKLEQLVKKSAKNESADFYGSRRVEEEPWMALLGVVANGGNPLPDGTPTPHETFLIGTGVEHSPAESGYLFCFANDAWNFYNNNRGSVRLSITRQA